MTFTEQVYVTLIDKFAIGVFILVATYLLNRAFKDFEGKQLTWRTIDTMRDLGAPPNVGPSRAGYQPVRIPPSQQ